MPIGFAGGLTDPDTHLVRFGYRDYDPSTGRFTALDPLGDTGGDHDLYDYCIDDPVTMNDPSGLIAPVALAAIAKVAALALGGGTALIAADRVDAMTSARNGKKSTAAVDAMKGVAPHVLKAVVTSITPSKAVLTKPAMMIGKEFLLKQMRESKPSEEQK